MADAKRTIAKLAPCPFCGGEAAIFQHDNGGWQGLCVCECDKVRGPYRLMRQDAEWDWNRRAAPQPAASDVPHAVVRAVAAEREACIKLASEYCWMRYKGRPPANLYSSCVFTSHEWQKIAEAMRGERAKADALATPAPSTSTEEVYGWHRSKGGFEIDFMRGPDRPRNATSAPDEWVPLYTAVPSSTEEALRAENAAIASAIGSPRFMDPPDGGDVSLAEQVTRMRQSLETAEAENARLREELACTLDELIDHNGDDMIDSRQKRADELRSSALSALSR